jgi:hypothetical protein
MSPKTATDKARIILKTVLSFISVLLLDVYFNYTPLTPLKRGMFQLRQAKNTSSFP